MKINEFKKLEKKINDQNFNQSYKTINLVMTFLSYFGHIASIFLAYFMLSGILRGAMTNNEVAVFIASVIILGGLELLKRDIFDKFSIQFLKLKTLGRDVLPLFLLSVTIISFSFYASINGAHEYASKGDVIEKDKKEIMVKFSDSITKIYSQKTISIETEIKNVIDKIESKDKEQTELESIQPPTRSAKLRIKDLKDEKKVLRGDVSKLEGNISVINKERDKIISDKKKEVESEKENQKKDNSKNSFAFVIISTLIEIVILAGVYFGEYYKYRSYREFRDKIEKDPNYQKWLLYNEILEIIYTEDTKMNQKLPSNKSIVEMCKVNEIIVMPKDMTNFLKTAASLGIIKVSGSTRYVNKQRDLAFEILRKHFNIE